MTMNTNQPESLAMRSSWELPLGGLSTSQFHQANRAPDPIHNRSLMDWNGDGKSLAMNTWNKAKDTPFFESGGSWMGNIGQIGNLAGGALSLAGMMQNLRQGKESFNMNKDNMEKSMAIRDAEYQANLDRRNNMRAMSNDLAEKVRQGQTVA
jgi:hypothetical protein